MDRLRIAVVSPFIDKRHGTERRVAEFISRLSEVYEFHIYSERVEDIDIERVVWHRIPKLPGPHFLGYLWWYAANSIWRWYDGHLRGLRPDVVYSPGVNCTDADIISVHVVFASFRERVKSGLRLWQNPLFTWPQIIHRRLYYGLIAALEKRTYKRSHLPLAVISLKVAKDLNHYYDRSDAVTVVYGGLDSERFSPERCAALRDAARKEFSLDRDDFVLLLVGNDWKSKGLPCVLEAVTRIGDTRLRVLVAGRDNPAPFAAAIARGQLENRVTFLPSRPDVEFFYAAADAYVGPSLEDAFAQPPAESMACGLPVITSRNAGVAEIIAHGHDGFILEDPTDSVTLSKIITRFLTDPAMCRSVGAAAVRTAQKYTWERNAEQMRSLFEEVRVMKMKRSEN